jgi:hypothetical protein
MMTTMTMIRIESAPLACQEKSIADVDDRAGKLPTQYPLAMRGSVQPNDRLWKV